MAQRCTNPNSPSFRWYGAKGVSVCAEWRDFHAFEDWSRTHGYADDLTIDRRDASKGYAPDNCQWITLGENSRRARLGETA